MKDAYKLLDSWGEIPRSIIILVLGLIGVRVILALTRLHRLGALRGSQGLAEG